MANKYVLKVGDGYLKGATLRSDTVSSPSKAKIFTTVTLPDKIEGRNYTYVLDKKKMRYIDQRRGMAFSGPEVLDYHKEKKAYDRALNTVVSNLKTGKTKRPVRYANPFEAILKASEVKESIESMLGERVDDDTVDSIGESMVGLAKSFTGLSDGNKAVLNQKLVPEAAQRAMKEIPKLAADGPSMGMEIMVTKSVAKAMVAEMAHRLQRGMAMTSTWIGDEIIKLIKEAASPYGIADGIIKRQFDNLMYMATAWSQWLTGRIQTLSGGATESIGLRHRSYIDEETLWPEIKDTVKFAKGMVLDHGKKETGRPKSVNYRGPDITQPSEKAFTTKQKHSMQTGVEKFMVAAKKQEKNIPRTMIKLIKKLDTWGSDVYNHEIADAFKDFIKAN